MYPYVNTDPGSTYYGKDYYVETAPHGEEAHVYQDGRKDYVPDSYNNIPAAGWSPPGTPTYGSTGGTPAPVPVAAPPAAPPPAAPPPAAPAPPPSNPAPPPNSGSAIEGIDKQEEEIKSEIGRMAGAQLPKQAYVEDNQIQMSVRQLQNQIYGAYESGALSQQQMQDMESTTVQLGMTGIRQEMETLKKLGSASPIDQTDLKAQYDNLSAEIREMEQRGALPKQSTGELSQTMQVLEKEINTFAVPSGSTPTPNQPPTTLGGQTGSSSGSSDNNNNSGSSSSSSSSSSGGGAIASDGGGTNAPLSSVAAAPTAPSGDSTSSTPATPVASGATYTVVSGDTMWGIAQSNNIPLSQLEALNPQIQHPELILPGESINIGSGGVDTNTSTASSGATYTVVHGDTLSGIAEANGMSTSQIEALNPQIKDPDLIFPGQSVNLGSGSTATPDSSQPAAVVVGPSTSTDTSGSANSGITGSSTSSGGGAIGFPDKSSYSNIGSETAKAGDITLGEKAAAQGWADSSGGAISDIAKNVFEVDNHTSTDPLKIDEKK